MQSSHHTSAICQNRNKYPLQLCLTCCAEAKEKQSICRDDRLRNTMKLAGFPGNSDW